MAIVFGTSIENMYVYYDRRYFYPEPVFDLKREEVFGHYFIRPIHDISRIIPISRFYHPKLNDFPEKIRMCVEHQWINFAAIGKILEVNFGVYSFVSKYIRFSDEFKISLNTTILFS